MDVSSSNSRTLECAKILANNTMFDQQNPKLGNQTKKKLEIGRKIIMMLTLDVIVFLSLFDIITIYKDPFIIQMQTLNICKVIFNY